METRDARREPLLEELAHPEVGVHLQRELPLAGIPAAGPVAGDPEAYPYRIDLLTHTLILLAVADADGDVTVALDDARATPLGAGGKALELRSRVHLDERYFQLVDVGAVIVLGVGDRGLEYLAHQPRALLRHEAQRRDRIADRLAAHHLGDQPALLRGNARVAQFGGHLHRVLRRLQVAATAASTLRSPECALKVRVGANSPSLCPTMFSVISTGTCWRPLCTAMVRPTISGTTGERRDQVLIGLRSLRGDATCTFLARCRSTNGPFFSERGMCVTLPISGYGSGGAGRSCCPCACCDGSSVPWCSSPTATPGADCPGRTCPRRHRAGDRPGSWPVPAPSGVCPSSAWRRPCRSCAGCARRCPLHRWWRGSRRAPCGSRPTSAADTHRCLRVRRRTRNCRRCAPAARRARASSRRCG